jgi:hypothetical protein
MSNTDNNTMLPDLQSSLICDDVRQERNGKFMLIGIFDALGVPKYPAVFQRICMVNRWCCGVGNFSQQTRLLKPDGVTVVVEGNQVPVKLPNEHANATCIEVFMNVKLDEPGIYWVEILLEGRLILRYPLNAAEINQPSQPPPQA